MTYNEESKMIKEYYDGRMILEKKYVKYPNLLIVLFIVSRQ